MWVVEQEDEGMRLDLWVSDKLRVSRTTAKKWIKNGLVLVNGMPGKASTLLEPGLEIEAQPPKPLPSALEPEPIPINVVYEDEDLLVVNKPCGMVVHPGAGQPTGTLVQALLFHCKDLSGIGGVMRPGIVHRLDKDTSGLLVVAKNDLTHESLSSQIAERHARRTYRALVFGRVAQDKGKIVAPIGRDPRNRLRMAIVPGGRDAITLFSVRRRYAGYTDLDITLETGRTHQIRVHLSSIGHPVVGDSLYGAGFRRLPPSLQKCVKALDGTALHAAALGFTHPGTGKKMTFKASLPAEFQDLLDAVEKNQGTLSRIGETT